MSQPEAGLFPTSLSKVEYLTTFNAFIFGYVVSRYLQEWGRLINRRRSVAFSVEHFLWPFLGFALLIDLWWSAWVRLKYIDWFPFYSAWSALFETAELVTGSYWYSPSFYCSNIVSPTSYTTRRPLSWWMLWVRDDARHWEIGEVVGISCRFQTGFVQPLEAWMAESISLRVKVGFIVLEAWTRPFPGSRCFRCSLLR